jgi:hypothetical protein
VGSTRTTTSFSSTTTTATTYQHQRSNECEEREGGEIMALISTKEKRPEKQELWSDCVFLAKTFLPSSPTRCGVIVFFWRKHFYRPLLHVVE